MEYFFVFREHINELIYEKVCISVGIYVHHCSLSK